jgi:hypothetical protein
VPDQGTIGDIEEKLAGSLRWAKVDVEAAARKGPKE